jgi:3-dehydroquinate synthase
MPAFRVETPQGAYDAVVERGSVRRVPEFIPPRSGKIFVVTTEDVWKLHGSAIRADEVLFFAGGEARKRISEVEALAEAMLAAGADRTSVVIAFGGGIVNDVGGFLAAIFMRGVPVIQVPTTLLAQVDASIGGKVGVNLAAGKNLVGAFHSPLLVATDPSVLQTLPRREYRAGLYEVIKYGMACSDGLFRRLEAAAAHLADPDAAALTPIIAECSRIKAAIVSADEREAGPRRVLNFGHTAGHAIEAATEYQRFRHGEAVAWGMLVASRVAVSRGLLTADEAGALKALIMKLGPLPPVADLAAGELTALMRRDKKVVDGTLHFVLPTAVGTTAIVDDVTEHEVLEALSSVGITTGGAAD